MSDIGALPPPDNKKKDPPASGGGQARSKLQERGEGGGIPRDHSPADPLRTKTVRYDQAERIAMAPHDDIGAFGWAALGGLFASLPATVQDLIASYGPDKVPLTAGRLVDVCVTAIFVTMFVVSRCRGHEATSHELLEKLFPEKRSKKKSSDDDIAVTM